MTCNERRVARFLRSIPNLDDPSSLLEEVRRKDSFCKDLDVLRRHRDLHSLAESHGEKLSEIEKAVKLLSAPADSTLVREPPGTLILQSLRIRADEVV